MFIDYAKTRLFMKAGSTDMRKQINGLSIIVEDEFELSPFSQSLFIFCNKRRNRMKILYWDRNGFCLWLKRLEKDKFPWPKEKQDIKEIRLDQLKMILDGIDFWKAHKELKYLRIN